MQYPYSRYMTAHKTTCTWDRYAQAAIATYNRDMEARWEAGVLGADIVAGGYRSDIDLCVVLTWIRQVDGGARC